MICGCYNGDYEECRLLLARATRRTSQTTPFFKGIVRYYDIQFESWLLEFLHYHTVGRLVAVEILHEIHEILPRSLA
jgi:hypothetical protein